jgi:integrase
MQSKSRAPEGITVRHSRRCPSLSGGRCNAGGKAPDRCRLQYQANVWSNAERKRIRKTFPTLAAAKSWRRDALRGIEKGTMRAPMQETLEKVAETWLADAEDGKVLNRSGEPYKPSVLRSYRDSLRLHVYPTLGSVRASSITRFHLQALVDDFQADGLSPSSIRNAINPVRAIYRYLVRRGKVAVNPTTGLELPAVNGRRERVASPAEAAELLAALPEEDQALWATAFYAGLRRGELRALRCEDVNSAVTLMTVRRSWDDAQGEIEPKSKKGTRRVPITGALRTYLQDHLKRTGRVGRALVFGRTATDPFTPSHIRRRAAKAWADSNQKRADKELPPLVPIGLHECRHTFVTLMHEAGVPLERIGDYVGHSTTYMTDRYRHLLEGSEERDAAKLDAYLAV